MQLVTGGQGYMVNGTEDHDRVQIRSELEGREGGRGEGEREGGREGREREGGRGEREREGGK